jgi:hypothetical protein
MVCEVTSTDLESESESSNEPTATDWEIIFWIVAMVAAGVYVMWRYQ